MVDLRKIIGEDNRPFLSNEDRVECGRAPTDLYHEEGHHTYLKHAGGTTKSIEKIFAPVHYANHRLFGASNFVRKVYILMLMDQKSMRPEFIDDAAKIVEKWDDEYVYRDGVFVRR